MKLIAIALTATGLLATAGTAAAAVSDVEFLRASRCRGLAESGVAQVDTAAMDAFLKAEQRTRTTFVADRGKAEFDKARREGKTDNAERKARLTAELNGPCQAYKG
ncbi:hypothetical protein [Phenylobacterium sp.]|jgi:hypothetical protein|uniref:hypothetical protein n=1 Tax=Phenylobacterium sp. TaxID=1871053 RepID=UPI0035B49CA9